MVFKVEKMMCSGCETNIKNAFSKVDGIDNITINLANKIVDITGSISTKDAVQIIADAGYTAVLKN